MHLTPREEERLLISAGADLARRRLARGARLAAPEATALVCDEICEMAWDGLALEEVVRRAREVVPPDALAPGVASVVPRLQVEALFPHGSVLVHVDAPFGSPEPDGPGAVRPRAGVVELSPRLDRRRASLHNRGALPVWVSSHVALGQVNPALAVRPEGLDRFRVDLPAGAAVRVAPGETRDVEVVPLGGGGQ